jgi:hypothetical protein
VKVSEARKILSHMVGWFFYFQGLGNKKPEPMSYSLEDMLKAQRLVDKAEERQKGRIDRKDGVRKRSASLRIDPRGIAAMYVAMNYQGGPSKNPEPVAFCNDNYVFVVRGK